jgi:hypothetical protein
MRLMMPMWRRRARGLGKLRVAENGNLVLIKKPHPFFHGTGFIPDHRQLNLLPMSSG